MSRQQYSARIGTHFLSALINGDESGLSSEDKEQLTEWLSQFDGTVAVCTLPEDDEDYSEDSFFGSCEICRLKADVMDVVVMIDTKDEGSES